MSCTFKYSHFFLSCIEYLSVGILWIWHGASNGGRELWSRDLVVDHLAEDLRFVCTAVRGNLYSNSIFFKEDVDLVDLFSVPGVLYTWSNHRGSEDSIHWLSQSITRRFFPPGHQSSSVWSASIIDGCCLHFITVAIPNCWAVQIIDRCVLVIVRGRDHTASVVQKWVLIVLVRLVIRVPIFGVWC